MNSYYRRRLRRILSNTDGKIEISLMSSQTPCKGGWGPYVHLALVVHDKNEFPCRIDERLRCVHDVFADTGKVYDGLTENCASARAREELTETKKELEVFVYTWKYINNK